jgi:hypothetical protein
MKQYKKTDRSCASSNPRQEKCGPGAYVLLELLVCSNTVPPNNKVHRAVLFFGS